MTGGIQNSEGEEVWRALNTHDRIIGLDEYFSLSYSPEKIKDWRVAEEAVILLDKIKELTGGCEYDFLYVHQRGLGGYALPWPADHNPTNAVNQVLGRYGRQFFVGLREKLGQEPPISAP